MVDHLEPVRVVVLDAFGTLVQLQPPGPRLRAALLEQAGVDVGEERARRAFEAEIAYYVRNHLRGRDREGLHVLHDECAAAVLDELAAPGLDHATVRRAMLGALEFTAFPDVLPALQGLRERGMRLVVASNWDCSLPVWLERAGVWKVLDGAVSSAVVGEAKPSPAMFRAALDLVGAAPEDALHVGDSHENDFIGARAAGLRPVLMVREGPLPEGLDAIRSLRELLSLI